MWSPQARVRTARTDNSWKFAQSEAGLAGECGLTENDAQIRAIRTLKPGSETCPEFSVVRRRYLI